jgi:DNA-binding NtrC family response regulator
MPASVIPGFDTNTPILIVDDNPQYSMVLQRILQSAFKFESIAVCDTLAAGYAALKRQTGFYKVLFVDFRFPGTETGAELLVKLSREGLLAGVSAFLITSEPTVDNMKMALGAGAVGVVAKPFDRDELARQLDKAARVKNFESEGF